MVGAEAEGASPEEHSVLYKYSPAAGKVISKKTVFHGEKQELELEAIYGVAVDEDGGVWVYWGEEGMISGFSNAEANRWEPSLTKEPKVREAYECRARPGFAVAANDEYFYIAHERETGLEECPEEETTPSLVAKVDSGGRLLAKGLDNEATSGVTVEAGSGEVYADNLGSVVAFSAGGSLIQRFGAGQLSGGGAIAVDRSDGEVFVAEPAANKIAVFVPEGAGAPVIDSAYAQALAPGSERLLAQIDPRGADTHYYFQYGTGDCVVAPASCTDAPVPPGTDIGAGFGDQSAEVELQGLVPNTTYYYRVLAENENGVAESEQSTQTFFTTLPASEGVLLDHRSWELVSPPEKHGATVGAISREGALIQAASGGEAITWTATAPVTSEAEGNRRPEPLQVISTRDPVKGWSSKDVTTPHNKGEGYAPGSATEYRFFSPDLSLALVQPQMTEPFEDPPLSPEAREKTMYRRNNATGEYEALVTAGDDTANSQFGGKLEFRGATAELQQVVFESKVPLLAGAGSGLYEWESGAALKSVSVLPGPQEMPASEPSLGDLDSDVRNAISRDGSRVFWTNGDKDEGPLFVRDMLKDETVQVNAAQGAPEPNEAEREVGDDEVHFQMASSDGSRVFFTDTWPLTKDSTLEPVSFEAERPVDLYELDLETGKLSDLSVDTNVGEFADVLGILPGVSEDGSYVYFIANGVLAAGAEPGDCPRSKPEVPQPHEACNLYVSGPDPQHPGQRQTRLIARLSAEDGADWGRGHSQAGSLGGVTSRVSPNGRYLAFMSQQELTGYHNTDANPEALGAHDEEVFLYDARSGRLTCASCNPDGEAPHGVLDTEQAGEGVGLTVDHPEAWNGHWLAGSVPGWTLVGLIPPVTSHQSRYLSNSGRLFFNSADALTSHESPSREEIVNGKPTQVGVENVYQYEPQGIGSCDRASGCVALISSGTSEHESAFLDASENGNDVFFLTAAQLVASDLDGSDDVYDARVCGTNETQPCLPPPPPPLPVCAGEECRPPPSAQLSMAPAASATYSGPGNLARQEVRGSTTSTKPGSTTSAKRIWEQKLAHALKLCRTRYKRSHAKRSKCERRARESYRASIRSKHVKKSSARAKKRGSSVKKAS